MKVLTILSFLSIITSINISHETFNPPIVSHMQHNITYQVFSGAIFQHEIQSIKSTLQQSVLKRIYYNQNETLDFGQLQQRPQLYSQIDSCSIRQSSVTFKDKIDIFYSQSQIQDAFYLGDYAYAIVEHNLTVINILFNYQLQTPNIIYNNQINVSSFNSSRSKFFSVSRDVYLTDGNIIYLINLNNLTNPLTKVDGFQTLQTGQQLLKIQNKQNTNSLIILTSLALYNHKFITKTACERTKYNINFSSHMFVDIVYNKSGIYLLDIDKGLYFMKDSTTSSQIQNYNLGIQQNIKFKKMKLHQNTIEIIFQFARQLYIVELIIKNDIMYINRYYDEIDGFKDINFVGDNVFLIGDDEILQLQHSIPQSMLLKLGRINKNYYYDYGMESFGVVKSLSNSSNLVLFGYNDYGLILAHFLVTSPTLVCNINGQTKSTNQVLFVNITSTTCPYLTSGQYCSYLQFIILQIIHPVGKKFNVVLIILTILVVIIILFILISLMLRFKARKNKIMQSISNKIQQLKATATTQMLKI